jgi:hypothetical protein
MGETGDGVTLTMFSRATVSSNVPVASMANTSFAGRSSTTRPTSTRPSAHSTIELRN